MIYTFLKTLQLLDIKKKKHSDVLTTRVAKTVFQKVKKEIELTWRVLKNRNDVHMNNEHSRRDFAINK